MSGQRVPWGNTISESQENYYANPIDLTYDLGPYAGFNTNFDTGVYPYTNPVGYFVANGYGLNDMAGNVLEWCWDVYATPYGQPTNTNPTGPVPVVPNPSRVVRGGAWLYGAGTARCGNRVSRNYADYNTGFRCVRGH